MPRTTLDVIYGEASWRVDTVAIDRARVLRGWSKGQLARAAKVDPKTVGNMLLGRRRPTLGTVRAVATSLDLPLGDVIVFDV